MECHLFYANRRKIRSAGYANHANLRKSVTKHNTRENLNQQVNRDVFASSRSPLKNDHNHHTTLIMLHNFAPPKCHDCDRRSCLSANGGSAWLTSIVSPFSLSSTLLVCFEQFRLFLCFYISLIPSISGLGQWCAFDLTICLNVNVTNVRSGLLNFRCH